MKKVLVIMGLVTYCINSYSQTNLWWKLDGSNAATSTSALGTSNNEPLRFKANGTEWLRVSPVGTYTLFSLTDPSSNGILVVRANGELARINYTGNTNDVFLGNGTFGSLSTLTGWSLGINLFTNYNVGIGTDLTPEKLTVNGNILANGSISGTSLNVVDFVTSGRQFKISTSLCIKGIDVNTPGSRNELCGMNGDLFIQSETNNTYNTVLNYGNNTKVGIGIIPTEDFHVGLVSRFDKDVFTDKIYTNRITSEDTVIHVGDSSILFIPSYNKISWTNTSVGILNSNGQPVNLPINGLTIGRGNSLATGNNSIALGTDVIVSGGKSIVIGSGVSSSSNGRLNNNITNSLMIGFNSNIPTLFVSSANGNNTIGSVGIGTTCVPSGYVMAVNGKIMMSEGTVRMADASGCWPDFVFDENYELMSWEEKEKYIQINKHLPHLPSAKEVDEEGLNIGNGMAAITQNVEENTLDIIEIYKQMEEMKAEIERLKAENEELKKK